jgi:hypothetical protein
VLQTTRIGYYAYTVFHDRSIDMRVMMYDLLYSVGSVWILNRAGMLDEEAAQSVLIRVLLSWALTCVVINALRSFAGAEAERRGALVAAGGAALLAVFI